MSQIKVKDKDGNWIGIPSLKGDPGYTPQKYIDYWTDNDRAEMYAYIQSVMMGMEHLLNNILLAIQQGGNPAQTVEEIERLIVEYFETKTVEEVEE
jgi:hypothetical protein